MKLLNLLFVLLLFFSCTQSKDSNYDSSSSKMESANSDTETAPPAAAEIISNRLVPSEKKVAQKIIKTANLSYEVSDLDVVHTKILQLTSKYEGLIQDDNSGKDYSRLYKNLVIRVPSENFESFLKGVSEGINYFDQKEISQQDVSEEFVDLEARLRAKRELENRYLELLKQAKTVEDMLKIERELSTIREEIEAKQGRLQFLQNRVSLSTVTINIYKNTSETGVTQSYGQQIKNALAGGWDGISVFFIGILCVWPLFLFAILSILSIHYYLKRKKESK